MCTAVLVWEEQITLPTYHADPPERLPIFLDKRVYQGSTGRVYPNGFTERISSEKQPHSYRAVYLENEFVRLMMLPEIGGRIHVGFDKTKQYDFFYRQQVIKPALVGLLGPWISGGVEFNWPQHHRPSTFMPVEHAIEKHEDGSATVWMSEHEPMHRMKGMVGICLHAGKSLIEAKVRLYNRTPITRTFLWWANMAVRVHDDYMAFFPQDVHWVADHAKRAISQFPIARSVYYGVDYSRGVDIRWYKNIPVPTSYMVTNSNYDFFGGYDFSKNAGVIHVADRHIAPGKKMWTWGSHEFGQAWDRELTDEDGPYIELMAGVYTDNQPDFSFLAPYETRTFSQFWYPIQDIGPAVNANTRVALKLEVHSGEAAIGVCPSEPMCDAMVRLTLSGSTIWERKITIAPGVPFLTTVQLPFDCSERNLELSIHDATEKLLLSYRPEQQEPGKPPRVADEPAAPETIASNDELYVTGLHLEQYRHATRFPESYWGEALRRDPQDSRVNTATALEHLQRGEFAEAITYLERALARLTRRNPNPREGEAYYALGLAKRYINDLTGAEAAFAKSAWNWQWQVPAYYALATLAARQKDFASAHARLDQVLARSSDCLHALHLKAALFRHSGDKTMALKIGQTVKRLDQLDCGSEWERTLIVEGQIQAEQISAFFTMFRNDPQLVLDLALDYAVSGFHDDAKFLIEQYRSRQRGQRVHPMLLYTLAWIAAVTGDHAARIRYHELAMKASPNCCFPSRVEEMLALESALLFKESDVRAHLYLGTFFYDRKRRREAIHHWRRATDLDPLWAVPWRNLGLALFNIHDDASGALDCYQRAMNCEPENARLFYEWDQLQKRGRVSPEHRLALFREKLSLVKRRDDLTIEFVSLLNLTGQHQDAIEILTKRRFHPWEGGEGLVSEQWVGAHFWLACSLIIAQRFEDALKHLLLARHYPENLGEGKSLFAVHSHLDFLEGVIFLELGRIEEATIAFDKGANVQRAFAPSAAWQAKALEALGEKAASLELLQWLEGEANARLDKPPKVEYFATSLPNFVLFEDNVDRRNAAECLRIRGLAKLAQGERDVGNADLKAALELDPNDPGLHLELRYAEFIATSGVEPKSAMSSDLLNK